MLSRRMQAKLASREAKRPIEGAETKNTCISPNFVKIIFLSVFSLFDCFLLILVLENSKVLVQAWTLRNLVRKALKNERENFGVQHMAKPLFKNTFRNTIHKHTFELFSKQTLCKCSYRDKNYYKETFQNTFKTHTTRIQSNKSKWSKWVTKSPWKTMMKRVLIPPLFIIYPPNLRNNLERSFLCFFTFPYWIKEK